MKCDNNLYIKCKVLISSVHRLSKKIKKIPFTFFPKYTCAKNKSTTSYHAFDFKTCLHSLIDVSHAMYEWTIQKSISWKVINNEWIYLQIYRLLKITEYTNWLRKRICDCIVFSWYYWFFLQKMHINYCNMHYAKNFSHLCIIHMRYLFI